MSNLQIQFTNPLSGSNIPTSSLMSMIDVESDTTETGETKYAVVEDFISYVDSFLECPSPERTQVTVYFCTSGSITSLEPTVKDALQQLQTSYGSTIVFGYEPFSDKRTFRYFNMSDNSIVIQGESEDVYTKTGSVTDLAEDEYYNADSVGNMVISISDPSIPNAADFASMLTSVNVGSKFTHAQYNLNIGNIQYYYDVFKDMLTTEGIIS